MADDFAAFNHGDPADGDHQTASRDRPLAPGTCTYAVYDAEGVHYTVSAKDEAAKCRVASGRSTFTGRCSRIAVRSS